MPQLTTSHDAPPHAPVTPFRGTPPKGVATAKKRKPNGISGGAIAKGFFTRTLHPGHLVRAAKLQVERKAHRHTFDDAQLALYAKVLPSEFLHFGYFDDAGVLPENMSLSCVTKAQARYADLLMELAAPPAVGPALDVGCGMGGLTRLLRDRGYDVTALTPDRLQAAHVAATLPGTPVVRSKFERIKVADHAGKYGTVFTSESLQYLKLDQSLPILAEILKPGGRWVACDYFHARPSDDPSLHVWDPFLEKLEAAGWRVAYQRDITAHVMPTLAYAHMWATRFGVPLMQFAFLRLRRKQPGLHHLLGGVMDVLEKAAHTNIGTIDPTLFAADKRYMMLAIERAG